MRLFVILFVLLLSSSTSAQKLEFPIIFLKILGYTIFVETAYTKSSRSQGLMYRETLGENNGMLFVFPKVGRYSMWMLNTRIPLSVAFIDESGIILNIAKMIPHSKIAHNSVGTAKYALEMNSGWFEAKRIRAGVQVVGLEKAPIAN
tara:strand:- start:3551 stop:3991 length:441 start_codon:yes stop_codon:yes gene_type:complete